MANFPAVFSQVVLFIFYYLFIAMCNKQVPVYTGHNYGLVDTVAGDNWYGVDGFGDLPFTNPPSPTEAQKEHAASFLARIVQEYPGGVVFFYYDILYRSSLY